MRVIPDGRQLLPFITRFSHVTNFQVAYQVLLKKYIATSNENVSYPENVLIIGTQNL